MRIQEGKHAITCTRYNNKYEGFGYIYENHFTGEKTEINWIPKYCDEMPVLTCEIIETNGNGIPITETKIKEFNTNKALQEYIETTNMKAIECPEWYSEGYDCQLEYMEWLQKLKKLIPNKSFDEVIQDYYGDTIGNTEYVYIDFTCAVEELTDTEIQLLINNGYEVIIE